MRKILALLMAAIICLGCFAGCKDNNSVTGSATLDDAVTYLESLYKDGKKETPVDYDVVGKVIIDSVEFSVTWETDKSEVSVKESDKEGFYTIDVPGKTSAEIPYTLTATVKDSKKKTKSVSFDRVVPVVDNADVIYDLKEGVAYKFFLKHGALDTILYAIGETENDKYIKTTREPKEGADFFAERVDGGYKFYTMINGVKKYIKASTQKKDDGKVSKYVGYADDGSVWYYKKESSAWFTEIDNAEYVVGTYGSYTTISISEGRFMTAETSGKTQFPAGFMEKSVAEEKEVVNNTVNYKTAKEILTAAYALEAGKYLAGAQEFTLTGIISKVDYEYNEAYGNITVTIICDGLKDMPLQCYRLSGDGVENLKVGNTITVKGPILKYAKTDDEGNVTSTTVEMEKGTLISSNATGSSTSKPQAPVISGVTDFKENTPYKLYVKQVKKGQNYFATSITDKDKFINTTTVAKAGVDFYLEKVSGGYKMYFKSGNTKNYLAAKTTVDGEKTSKFVYYASTGSVWYYKKDVKAWFTKIDGKEYVLGTYGTYTTISLSDSSYITVENSGKTQFPATLADKATAEAAGSSSGSGSTAPTNLTAVANPVAGTAYKLYMVQNNAGKTLFLKNTTQDNKNKYIETVETAKSGADFYVEKSGDGVKIYTTIGGQKKYVLAQLILEDGKTTKSKYLGFGDTGSVFTYDSAKKTWFVTLEGAQYGAGTYNTFTTASISDGKYFTPEAAGVTQFPIWFATKANAENATSGGTSSGGTSSGGTSSGGTSSGGTSSGGTSSGGTSSGGTSSGGSSSGTTIPAVTPVVGTAYNIALLNTNKSTTDIYYLTGVLSGYYGASSSNVADAAKFYLENATGGYYVYAMVSGDKMYVNTVASGNFTNIKFEDTASTVYTYSTSLKTVVTTLSDTEYAVFGTRADKSYTTVGPVKTSANNFYGQFVLASSSSGGTSSGGTSSGGTSSGGTSSGGTSSGGTSSGGSSSSSLTAVTAPVAGTAYKLFMEQNTVGKTFFALNTTQNDEHKYINTTETATDAADFYVEASGTGFKIYTTIGGQKKYVYAKLVERQGGSPSKYVGFADEGSVWTYNSSLRTWFTTLDSAEYGIGTYQSYTTFSISDASRFNTSNIGTEQFPMQLVTKTEAEATGQGGGTNPPADPTTVTSIKDVLAMTADSTGDIMVQGIITDIKVGTTRDEITIADSEGNKLLIYGVLDSTGVTRYNEMTDKPVVGEFITVVGPMTIYYGTHEIKDGKLSAFVSFSTIPEILAATPGTDTEYLVTGVIKNNPNSTYGTCYIEDGEGNELYIYGMYDATGAVRYDAMTTKPVAGDTVTLMGKVTQSGAHPNRIENAKLLAHEIAANEPTVEFVAANMGVANATTVTSYVIDDVITLGADKGTGQTAPAFYTTGNALRIYVGGTLTLTAKSGYKIDSIVITTTNTSDNKFKNATVSKGTVSGETTDTVTVSDINDSSITITNTNTSKHIRFVSIAIKYSAI